MNVLPFVAPSISITSDANNVCAGTTVSFLALAINGGSNPSFQWKRNGVNVGVNSTSYSYIPLNGDIITCSLTSDELCRTSNNTTSNNLLMNVIALVPVSVSITADQNSICQGTTVNYTANPSNGGTTPIYQWKVNGINAGTNSPAFSYIPVNGDLVTCTLTSGIACVSGNPAVSNSIAMQIHNSLPVSITINENANNICQGVPVSFLSTVVNGGTSPTYQWTVNGVNSGLNTAGFSYTPSSGDIVSCMVTSNLSCAGNTQATSNQVVMIVNAVMPASISVTADQTTVCQGTIVHFSATTSNSGTNPVYQWQVNGTNTGSNSSVFSYAPANGDAISCVLTSGLPCATNNPAVSNLITINVNPSFAASVSITATQVSACQGTTVTYTASAINGGINPLFQWRINGINAGVNSPTFSYIPLNGDLVTCSLTSNLTCSTPNPAISNAITMLVSNSLPVSVAITPAPLIACTGIPVTYTATPVNGGSSPTYAWFVNGTPAGTNSATYLYTPVTGDQVSCSLTSNALCATGNPANSNTITANVYPFSPVSISIAENQNNICSGTSVTYNALSFNGGLYPIYQWKVNGINYGTNSPTFSYTPVNNDIITCTLNSGIPCATGNPAVSNAIQMTVNPALPASVSITEDQNNICTGTMVTYSLTATNAGSNPVYQWKVNGINTGTNSTTFSYTPGDLDIITCELISDAQCATGNPAVSNAILMHVGMNLPASVTILPDNAAVCQGNPVTLTAVPLNCGLTPVYQWQINGINVGMNSSTYTFIPSNGDVVSCTMNSSLSCSTGNPAISNTVTLTVNPLLAPGISIAADDNNICQGTAVTFTSIALNGGSSPVYQWKRNGVNVGANLPSYTYIPANTDVISCEMVSNALCATGNPAISNSVIMDVIPSLPASISISVTENNVCLGSDAFFTAVATHGGTAPVYQWRVNGMNTGTNVSTFSYTPSNGDIVSCILVSDLMCSTGNPAISNSITMAVNPIMPVSVSITEDKNNVCQGTAVNINAFAVNGGPSPQYTWFVNGVITGSSSATYSFIPNNNDNVNCILNSNLACVSANPATSNTVSMSVSPILPVSITVLPDQNIVCQGTMVNFTVTTQNEGTSPTYQWMLNGLAAGSNQPVFSVIPNHNDQISCTLTSNALCTSGNPANSAASTNDC
jgi:hypothetical protein